MKYKVFIISLLLLFLTGCKFEYNVYIDSNKIKEDNVVYMENTTKENVEDEVYKIIKKYSGPTDELGMYKSSVVSKDSLFGVDYFADYNYVDYQTSPSFSLCYDKYRIVKDGNNIIISTNGNFKCFDMFEELEEVTINVSSPYKVLSSNADSINDGVYTWYLNRSNYNKIINIKLSTIIENADNKNKDDDNKNTNNVDNKKENSNNNNNVANRVNDVANQISAFWIVIITLIILGFIILIIKYIGKRNNQI